MQADKLRRAAQVIALVLVPLGLLHAFILAEAGVVLVDVLFLIHATRRRDFAWARQGWFLFGLAWWAWLTLCSLPLPHLGAAGWNDGFGEAVVNIRLFLFAAALQSWLLTTPGARRLAWWVVVASLLWIGVETWEQFLTGRNLFGDRRWLDGSLTGPFYKPRSGPLFAHLLYVAALPVAVPLLGSADWPRKLAGGALVVLGIVTSVLIGQRMGVAFAGLGLLIAAVFYSRLRLPMMAAVIFGAAVLAATPYISPQTHIKLVGETSQNFHHFSQSPYGEIYTRATVMGLQSPLTGWGMRGYRATCALPRFDGGLPTLHIPPTSLKLMACIQHPQNFYVQAFVDAGFPGLLLFLGFVVALTLDLWRGLWRSRDPLRVGLFIAALNYTWPIASTDEFPVMYMTGWFFLLLGLGLAAADAQIRGEETLNV